MLNENRRGGGSTQAGQDVPRRANASVALPCIIGTDHETARRVALGLECLECGEGFTRGHGTPTACSYCWPKLSLEERKVVNRATHPEETKEAFRAIAKTKKARRENV